MSTVSIVKIQHILVDQVKEKTHKVISTGDMQSHLGRMPNISLRSLPEELRGIDVSIDTGGGYELWRPLAEHVIPKL